MSFRINTNTTAMGALRNLSLTNSSFTQSVNRLSTGLRIVNAADDPSGLIFSENFRSQINGMAQAIRNNQDAINYTKTAEGAIEEISRLLRDGRALAVQSANSAVQSASQLQANQTQWNLIVQSINRIASDTAFGKKKLLDGSAGVNGAIVDNANFNKVSLSGTFNGDSITTDGAMDVNITTLATKATRTTSRTVASADEAAYRATVVGTAAAGQFSINGQQFTVSASDTWGEVVDRINLAAGNTGVTAQVVHDGTNGQIELISTEWGTKGNFTMSDTGVLESAAATNQATGVDAAATVTFGGVSVNFTGGQMGYNGLTLTDTFGNVIELKEGATTGNKTGAIYATVGSAQFQIGANAGERATLNIGAFSSAALTLDNLDLTSVTGANAALEAIDAAVESVSRKRGNIGAFMRNILESNVRSLAVAKENLTASESMVRDVDVAEEMTNYTRLQILQQSGLSVLSQANSYPQAVLSLLRG